MSEQFSMIGASAYMVLGETSGWLSAMALRRLSVESHSTLQYLSVLAVHKTMTLSQLFYSLKSLIFCLIVSKSFILSFP